MSAIVNSDNGSYDVHLGFWINWSSGRMQGATFTTTRESGGLLVAFIALYVSTSGRSFWRVSCFLLHRMFSSHAPMDGLHHQRQVILRNADTAAQGLMTLLYTLKWRRKASRPLRRILPVLLYAFIIWAAFTASGKSYHAAKHWAILHGTQVSSRHRSPPIPQTKSCLLGRIVVYCIAA